jgi:hypothetical protein
MGRNHRITDWNPEDAAAREAAYQVFLAAHVAAATPTRMLYVRRPNVPGSVPLAHHTRV